MHVPETIVEGVVKDSGITSVDQATYDDVVEVTLIGSLIEAELQEAGFMPDDEIESISGFETADDDEDKKSEHKEELSKTGEANADNLISHQSQTHLVIFKRISLQLLPKCTILSVADKIDDAVPMMVDDALEERLPKLLSNTLENILLDLQKDSVKMVMPKFDKRIQKTLIAKVPNIILKPLNRKFNALNIMES
nr:hypothetical protein [Tanacetum cinerariifolium]